MGPTTLSAHYVSKKPVSEILVDFMMQKAGQSCSVQFNPVGGHLVKVPVLVNGTIQTSFLVDTGAGLNAISERLCAQIQGAKSGSYTGKRMSGEELTLPFTTVPQLAIGDFEVENVRAGVSAIFEQIPKELGVIDGAISLRFFEKLPFTLNYRTFEFTIGAVKTDETIVPIQIERDDEKTIAFVEMTDFGLFEIDTGNSLAVLDLSKARKAGIDINSAVVKKIEGKNETGHTFVSYYSPIPELRIRLGNISQPGPTVAFKKIIHDGVIGNDFFKGRKITFDIAAKELRFN